MAKKASVLVKKWKEAGARGVSFTAFMREVQDTPDFDVMLMMLEAYVDEAEAFRVLASGSFLEGTLRLPWGTMHFEWDKEADPPLRKHLGLLIAEDEARARPAAQEKDA